jgi:thiosulfate reductase cytochrome b subunit
MKKIELYPIWIRIWHILQVILFLLLLISGVGMHFGLVPVGTSLPIHIYSGISMTALYLVFFVMNFASGNARHYFKAQKGSIKKFFAEYNFQSNPW